MPEGPEILMTSRFINAVCKGRHFSGDVIKSYVSKCPPIPWRAKLYTISAVSRGKELKLTLTDVKEKANPNNSSHRLDILFTFGLSGKFSFDPIKSIPKHAHLKFITEDKSMVLSYVDTMRFGKWVPNGNWNSGRGPCVLQEYELFRKNVLSNLGSSTFNKPICEVLLDQKFFNGIGNYLRAEILYRCGVRPFDKARTVLEGLSEDTKMKSQTPDILQLCHSLPMEVVNIAGSEQNGYRFDSDEAYRMYLTWIKCYDNPDMQHICDHNGRTIWFAGDPGPLIPKDAKKKQSTKSQKDIFKKSASGNERKTMKHPTGSTFTDQEGVKKSKSTQGNSTCNKESINRTRVTKLKSKARPNQPRKKDCIAKRTRSSMRTD